MTEYEVTHSTADGGDYDRRIDMIGGPAFGGWKMRQEEAIEAIRSGRHRFFVQAPARNIFAQPRGIFGYASRAYIEIRPGTLIYREHLATIVDGVETNNLRSLPSCPPEYPLVTGLP